MKTFKKIKKMEKKKIKKKKGKKFLNLVEDSYYVHCVHLLRYLYLAK